MMRFILFYRRFLAARQGYTLVVVAALFAAFAVAAVAFVDRNVIGQQIQRQQATRLQLTRLASALALYQYYNGYYPCPAASDVVLTEGTFGQAFTKTTIGCDTAPSGSPITALPAMSNTQIVRGMVPVHDLVPYGIDNNDAFDSWNDRIMYTVNRNLTTNPVTAATVRPTVTQITVNATLPPPDFVLVSYGADRLGAYQRGQAAGSLVSGPSLACTGTDIRNENCNNDLIFKIAAPFTATGASAANYFDDIVTAYGDGSTCDSDASNGLTSGQTYCSGIVYTSCTQYYTHRSADTFNNTCSCSTANTQCASGTATLNHTGSTTSACPASGTYTPVLNCQEEYTCSCN